MCSMKKKLLILSILLLILILWFSIKPSNNLEWSPDQAVLPYAKVEGDLIHVYDIRNFTYITTQEYIPNYYNQTYNLSELKSVDFMVEPFSGYKGAAHTLLSFGFNNGQYLAISVEIRKEKDEHFSAIKGLLKQYELMYVFGDEKDLIKLRSNYRNDTVFLYPVRASNEKIRSLFLDMIGRANSLVANPEFYNTLTNTCTTNIVSHVNKITPKRVPFSYKVLMPAYSDELAYDLGLIDTNKSFEETREMFKINELARFYADSPDFSVKIREGRNYH